MATNVSTSGNPFIRAAEQLRSTGAIDRAAITQQAPPARASRARLNFIPDGDTLSALIARGLDALRQGRIWDRGSILNLVV
jgi:hypothetical protein